MDRREDFGRVEASSLTVEVLGMLSAGGKNGLLEKMEDAIITSLAGPGLIACQIYRQERRYRKD